MKKYKFLIIGWCFEGIQYARYIAYWLREKGHICYLVSTDIIPIPNKQDPEIDYYLQDDPDYHLFIHGEKRIDIKGLINYFEIPDIIFMGQSSILHFDLMHITIPICYYHYEWLFNHFPVNGKIQLIFHAFSGAQIEAGLSLPPEVSRSNWIYVPYGIKKDFFDKPIVYPRPIYFGFKGALKITNGSRQPILMNVIYKDRVDLLQYAWEELDLFLELRSGGSDELNDWYDFMLKCNLALNIPGCIDGIGYNNEREFVAMALGCVLVQYRHEDYTKLELEHKKNCLLFKTKEELKECIDWAKNHPIELEKIRYAGKQLAFKMNWENIVNRYLGYINEYIFNNLVLSYNSSISISIPAAIISMFDLDKVLSNYTISQSAYNLSIGESNPIKILCLTGTDIPKKIDKNYVGLIYCNKITRDIFLNKYENVLQTFHFIEYLDPQLVPSSTQKFIRIIDGEIKKMVNQNVNSN